MQCLHSAMQLTRIARAAPLSPVTSTSIRLVSSQASAPDRRILLKYLPHASLGKDTGSFLAPQRQETVYHCKYFSLVLKRFPRHLTDKDGCLDESRLIPPWIPLPIDPAIHQRRHLRPPLYPPPDFPSSAAKETDPDPDRWEPIPDPASLPMSKTAHRPILRIFSLTSKKKLHKLAVIRNRARTRLVAALQTALFQWQASGADVASILDVRRHVVMLLPLPPVYSLQMDALVAEVHKALRSVTSVRPPRSFGSSSPNWKKKPKQQKR